MMWGLMLALSPVLHLGFLVAFRVASLPCPFSLSLRPFFRPPSSTSHGQPASLSPSHAACSVGYNASPPWWLRPLPLYPFSHNALWASGFRCLSPSPPPTIPNLPCDQIPTGHIIAASLLWSLNSPRKETACMLWQHIHPRLPTLRMNGSTDYQALCWSWGHSRWSQQQTPGIPHREEPVGETAEK